MLRRVSLRVHVLRFRHMAIWIQYLYSPLHNAHAQQSSRTPCSQRERKYRVSKQVGNNGCFCRRSSIMRSVSRVRRRHFALLLNGLWLVRFLYFAYASHWLRTMERMWLGHFFRLMKVETGRSRQRSWLFRVSKEGIVCLENRTNRL